MFRLTRRIRGRCFRSPQSSLAITYHLASCSLVPADSVFSGKHPHAACFPYLSLSSSREARSLVVQSPNNVVPFPRTAAACLESGHVVNPFLPLGESPLACRASAGLIVHSFSPVNLLGFDIMTKLNEGSGSCSYFDTDLITSIVKTASSIEGGSQHSRIR